MKTPRSPGYLSASIVSAAMLLAAGFYFGGSRDFGAFLLGIIALPILLLAVLTSLAIEFARKRADGKTGIAIVIALASPVAFHVSAPLKDRAALYIWASMHRAQLSQAMRKDGIVLGWDSWGLAGSGNDSYLVVDRADAIGSFGAAERWRKRLGLSCQIVDSQRMWSRLYLVTTYNCPFDGVALPPN
jgi:hypothetical protein